MRDGRLAKQQKQGKDYPAGRIFFKPDGNKKQNKKEYNCSKAEKTGSNPYLNLQQLSQNAADPLLNVKQKKDYELQYES